MTNSSFATLDLVALTSVTGGQAGSPLSQEYSDEGPPPRSWGQVAREYGMKAVEDASGALAGR